MHTAEVISRTSKAGVPIMNTASSLMEGLENIVGRGITPYFNEMVWTVYHDSVEDGETSQSEESLEDYIFRHDLLHQFKDTLSLVLKEEFPHMSHTPQRPNIVPVMRGLVRLMAAEEPGRGMVHRIDFLKDRYFTVMPAHFNHQESCEVEADPDYAIIFDGFSLIDASSEDGTDSELITSYKELPVFAYRDHAIGSFFVRHALKDQWKL